MPDLERFRRAQAHPVNGFEAALNELAAGQKRGHWIWYIFPQLTGLGQSSMATTYGLNGVGEAAAYLEDTELRRRLLAAIDVVARQLRRTPRLQLEALMGSEIDAVKLVSSMTLFGAMARRLLDDATNRTAATELEAIAGGAEQILATAARQGRPACAFTLQALARGTA